ncbi:MAG: ImmA/IrrE family metallo-endopeptidase [Clostridiales bacterium]|jgi:hypothetical protein|nr:ImmA/IrrE family metallo-endopeptidase [Eubacteriales bacterium]MDH7566899.1 ImmA/IrrE family metallo-endopeptidase [Clostridiales bacterium]
MAKHLTTLEKLLEECNRSGINIEQQPLPHNINAIYYEDEGTEPVITINELLKTQAEQACVLAEEIGHYHTSCGNLLTDPHIDKTIISKQEHIAKKWAVQRLVSLKNIIKAYEAGARNFYEMAQYLDVTEEFLREAFKKHNAMYGKYKKRGKYIIYFDPPGIYKNF